jgi:hypothetical protein
VLTLQEARQQRRRRSPPSLRQQYQEFVMQRVEAFKNSIPRDELLRLGDEAVSEMQATIEGQFTLTEVLMVDQVDRLIIKRLRLRSYARWREQYLTLRAAQREPMHWGVDPGTPVARILPRLEPGDSALVFGSGAEPSTYLLAAHDVSVTFVAGNIGTVERVESRMASESLGSQFQAFVVQVGGRLGAFVPPVQLAVVDAAELTPLDPDARRAVIEQIQALTEPGGVHAVLPARGLAPHAFRTLYEGWTEEDGERPGSGRTRREGLLFSKEMGRNDTT